MPSKAFWDGFFDGFMSPFTFFLPPKRREGGISEAVYKRRMAELQKKADRLKEEEKKLMPDMEGMPVLHDISAAAAWNGAGLSLADALSKISRDNVRKGEYGKQRPSKEAYTKTGWVFR